MAYRILALDLGTRTGWACSDGSSGTLDMARKAGKVRLSATIRHGRSAWAFADRLTELLERIEPDIVVVEMMTGTPKGEGARVLFGLRWHVLGACHAKELAVYEVVNSTWQPWARARGWAKTTDEHDAIWIRDWAAECLVPRIETGVAG